MKAMITVFKRELSGRPEVKPVLAALAREITELKETNIYSPLPGNLMPFLGVLRQHGIAYRTYFDNVVAGAVK